MTTEDPQKIKARLNDVAADVRDVYQDAVCCIADLQCQVSDMRADRDHRKDVCEELADANKTLQAELDDYKQSPGMRAEHYRQKAIKAEAERDEFKDAAFRIKRRLNAKTPHVITAEELKKGQVVALIGKTGVFQTAGKFTGWKQGLGITWFTVKTGRRGDDQVAYKDTDTIVLIADAPVDQQEPERLTVKWSGERRGEKIDPADFRDGDVVDRWNGHGERIAHDITYRTNELHPDLWFDDEDEFRLVHRPTPAPVTAETIRQSEPGTTWRDDHGDMWEWDGAELYAHAPTGLHDAGCSPDDLLASFWEPPTRSTAAPRGDYGKVEVPTEPRVTIDPAAYETMFSDQEFLQRLHNEITRNRLQGDPATAHERADDD